MNFESVFFAVLGIFVIVGLGMGAKNVGDSKRANLPNIEATHD